GGDGLPATGRAMPNAALECNSPRMVLNRPDRHLSAIMLKDSFKTTHERSPTLLYLTSRRGKPCRLAYSGTPLRRWIGQIVGNRKFPPAQYFVGILPIIRLPSEQRIAHGNAPRAISRQASDRPGGRRTGRNHLPAD